MAYSWYVEQFHPKFRKRLYLRSSIELNKSLTTISLSQGPLTTELEKRFKRSFNSEFVIIKLRSKAWQGHLSLERQSHKIPLPSFFPFPLFLPFSSLSFFSGGLGRAFDGRGSGASPGKIFSGVTTNKRDVHRVIVNGRID